jgi:hypothetical protein
VERLVSTATTVDDMRVVATLVSVPDVKSLQALGDGIRFEDVHVPMNALVPVIPGSVTELVCSKLKQPETAIADTASMTIRVRFFIVCISDSRQTNFRPPRN